MRRRKAALALLLAVCLCLSCAACQTGQDDIYSKALASQPESSLLEVASSNPFGEIDYDDPDYIGPPAPGPDAQLTPAPDDNLSGTLVIQSFQQAVQQPELYWLAREFMELHPGVTIKLDYDWKYTENLSLEERGPAPGGLLYPGPHGDCRRGSGLPALRRGRIDGLLPPGQKRGLRGPLALLGKRSRHSRGRLFYAGDRSLPSRGETAGNSLFFPGAGRFPG